MAVTPLQSFRDAYRKRDERLTEVAQVKFTPSEMEELDTFVEWLRQQGAGATRSGVVRALVVDGLDVFKEEMTKA